VFISTRENPLSDNPRFHRPKRAERRLGVGHTKLYELIGAGFSLQDRQRYSDHRRIPERYQKSLPKADIRTAEGRACRIAGASTSVKPTHRTDVSAGSGWRTGRI
jgi:hypothetical protein